MSILESTVLGISVATLIEITIIIVAAIVLERIVTHYLSGFAKRTKLEPNVANNLALTFRIIVLIGAVIALSRVSGVSPELVISISAIGGAAVGFASTKTIGNFIAGIFLISARPFKVGNYVRIGTVEGIVSEITINYTKVLTAANNIVSISNLQILDREITNFLYESTKNLNLYCYTFEMGFDHSVPADKISQIFDEVFDRHAVDLPKRPTYCFSRSTNADRVYTVYLYVETPQDIFTLKPQVAEEVFQRWDLERTKPK